MGVAYPPEPPGPENGKPVASPSEQPSPETLARDREIEQWDRSLEELQNADNWEQHVSKWIEIMAPSLAASMPNVPTPAEQAAGGEQSTLVMPAPKGAPPIPPGTETKGLQQSYPYGRVILVPAVVIIGMGALLYFTFVAPLVGGQLVTLLIVILIAGILLSLIRWSEPRKGAIRESREVERADTAVLVVHGMGQQERYSTLNSLVSGMDGLPDDGPISLGFSDLIPPLVSVQPQKKAQIGDVTGVQGLVRLIPVRGTRQRVTRRVDFYEGYWAPLAQRRQSLRNVLNWLLMTAVALVYRGAREDQNPDARQRNLIRKKARFELGWLLIAGLIAFLVLGAMSNGLMLSTRTLARAAQGQTTGALLNFAALSDPDTLNKTLPKFLDSPQITPSDTRPTAKATPRLLPLWTGITDPGQGIIYLKQIILTAQNMPWWAWGSAVAGLLCLALAGRSAWRLIHLNTTIAVQRVALRGREVRAPWYGLNRLQNGWYRQLQLLVLWLSLFVLIMKGAAFAAQSGPVVYQAIFTFTLFWLGFYALQRIAVEFFVNYLGDVTTYTVANENSETYQVRQQIKEKVSSVLESILASDQYRRVLVVGHSLGSVIARDVLLGLHRQWEAAPESEREAHGERLNKIKAFITIGSPLRKVQNFLEARWEKTPTLEALRDSHDQHFFAHARRRSGNEGPHPRWFNYWLMSDLVANPFRDRYPVYEEQEIQTRALPFWTHSDYWMNQQFLERLGLVIWGLPTNRNLIWRPDEIDKAG